MKKNEQSLGDTWDTIKCTIICIMVVPEGEKEGQKEHLHQKMTKKPQI